MRTIIDLLKLFFLNCKIKISRNMQYRFDFINGLFVSMLYSSIGVITLFVIYIKTNGYPGWTLNQIILFQGVLLLWNGLKDLIFGDVRNNINTSVRKGEFDRLLLKPFPPIGYILVSGPNYTSISSMVAGIIVMVIGLVRLNITVGVKEILFFLIFIISALFLYMAFLILYCIITVMIIYMGRISEIMDKLLRFSEYPLQIFSKGLGLVFTYVIPFSIFIYLPTQTFLRRLDIKDLISVPVSFLIFFATIKLWNLYLKKYVSAGG